MLNLGAFERDDKTGKITGVLYGVNMYPTKLVFEPMASEKGTPYYKIFAQSQHATVEAGAAWPKIAKNEQARPYLDVKLSSPGLAAPFYGKLMESETVRGQHHLLWDEPKVAPKAETRATNGQTSGTSAVRQAATLTP